MNVNLLLLEGKHRGRVIKLPRTQFVIGRDPSCHLRPACSDVSRFHCAIAATDTRIHLRDLRSLNGTFLNGGRVTRPVRIHHGDVLQVGKVRFQFQIDPVTPFRRPEDNELSWLMRAPEPAESLELDPMTRTRMLPVPDDSSSDSPSPTRWRADPGHETATAIAGKFLREYLSK